LLEGSATHRNLVYQLKKSQKSVKKSEIKTLNQKSRKKSEIKARNQKSRRKLEKSASNFFVPNI